MTDHTTRDLIRRMADELDHYRQLLTDDRREVHALAAEARAALARWGRPSTSPIPVSDRLPGPEDCDVEGMCWWWRTDDADEWWELLGITDAREHNARCGSARYTHWLPAHALPVPTTASENN